MMNSDSIGILYILPQVDLGGGTRRVQAYIADQDTERFHFGICVVAGTPSDLFANLFAVEVPVLFDHNPAEVGEFCRKHSLQTAVVSVSGGYDERIIDLLTELRRESIRIVVNNVFAYYCKELVDICDVMVFQTVYMRNSKFRRNLPADIDLDSQRFQVLYNPVRGRYLDQFCLSDAEREGARSALGFTPDQCVVGRFGRADIVKWGDSLTVAIWRLTRNPRFAFLIVGIPRSRRLLFWLLGLVMPRIRRQVRLLEPTHDSGTLAKWMQLMDICGHAVKIGEGCGNAINEAMYWGKPVVTNFTPTCDNGQAEQVDTDQTGYVVKDTDAFCEAIITLADDVDRRRAFGAAGREKVIREYNSEHVTAALEALIDELNDRQPASDHHTLRPDEIATRDAAYRELEARLGGEVPRSAVSGLLSFAVRVLDYLEYRWQGFVK